MKKPNKQTQQSIGVLTRQIGGNTSEVHLLPDGEFQTDDSRTQKWKLDSVIAASVIARADARERDTVIDYEHQTLHAEFSGVKAVAAGWFRNMEYREGEGLFITDTRWTKTASAHIDADEYRYISAVFTYDPDTGAIIRILHAGLTNDPALDGLEEIELRAAAKFDINTNQSEEDTPMNEEQLKLLGLNKDASEEEITAALKALHSKSTESEEEVASLKSKLEQGNGEPDPAKYVPTEVVESLKTEIASLKSNFNDNEVEDVVSLAMSEGRILPAQEDWARSLGKSDIAALKSYVETSPAITALKGSQTDGTNQQDLDDDGNLKLNETQIAACKAQGISEEAYLKALNEEQAST